MKLKLFFGIAIRIIFLFVIAMFATFIPDYLRDFFGDVYSPDRILFTSIDEHWEWGVRHYWYFCMMVILFLLALVNVGLSIYKLLNKNYNFSSGNGLCS